MVCRRRKKTKLNINDMENECRGKIAAFIPARAGSTRVIGKNVRKLGGYPLIAWTIAQAVVSEQFARIFVSTNCPEARKIAELMGCDILDRPEAFSSQLSPDIDWVTHLLQETPEMSREVDSFAILRPTSPFRRPSTISRAVDEFKSRPEAHSLRAVERVHQHPGKMWVIRDGILLPLLPFGDVPWHSSATQNLPQIYVQNASLEIARLRCIEELKSISGSIIIPFLTEKFEGYDINTEEDWAEAERIISDEHLVQDSQIFDFLAKHLAPL